MCLHGTRQYSQKHSSRSDEDSYSDDEDDDFGWLDASLEVCERTPDGAATH
jgi:hypothetical protein